MNEKTCVSDLCLPAILMHLINECDAQHDTHANNSDKKREKTPGIVLGDLTYS
jgi:hypothetical protein